MVGGACYLAGRATAFAYVRDHEPDDSFSAQADRCLSAGGQLDFEYGDLKDPQTGLVYGASYRLVCNKVKRIFP